MQALKAQWSDLFLPSTPGNMKFHLLNLFLLQEW